MNRLILILSATLGIFASETASCPSSGFKLQKWDFFVDILLWRADQIGTWALSALDVSTNLLTNVIVDVEPNNVLFDWSTGFRGGASYCLDRDHWDLQLFYTWFHTQKRMQAPGIGALSAFLGNWLTFGLNPFSSPIAANIRWAILLNMFDWQLSRNYFASKTISFRPSLGVKGGWIHQNIHSHWQLPEQVFSTENLENYFWGIGPKAGLDTQWRLLDRGNHSFYLFADTAIALLSGCWTFKDEQKTTSDTSLTSFVIPKTYAGTFMLQGLMGFGWDVCLNQNQSKLTMQLGLETQVWFDQLKIFTFLEGTLHNTLTLQGGSFDVSLRF